MITISEIHNHPLFAELGILLVFTGFIWGCAKKAESLLRKDALIQLSEAMFSGEGTSKFISFGSYSIDICRGLLCSNARSSPRFTRTSFVSAFAVISVLIAISLSTEFLTILSSIFQMKDDGLISRQMSNYIVLSSAFTFGTMLIANLCIDYISFAKGLALGDKFLGSEKVLDVIKFFVVDFLVTLFLLIVSAGLFLSFRSLGNMYDYTGVYYAAAGQANSMEIYVYLTDKFFNFLLLPNLVSTFAISILAIAFSFFMVLMRLLSGFATARAFLKKYFNTEEHPLLTAVSAGSFFLFFLFFTVRPISYLYS